jgi:hypothetical protein
MSHLFWCSVKLQLSQWALGETEDFSTQLSDASDPTQQSVVRPGNFSSLRGGDFGLCGKFRPLSYGVQNLIRERDNIRTRDGHAAKK